MKRYLILLFSLITLTGRLLGITIEISGEVRNLVGIPIVNQQVQLAELQNGATGIQLNTFTDINGRFGFNLIGSDTSFQTLKISTIDCQNNIIDTIILRQGNTHIDHIDFTICDNQTPGCLASFIAHKLGTNGGLFNVYFENTSIGNYDSIFWDFGDGTTSFETNPTHAYQIGAYNACLTILGDNGLCFDTRCQFIIADTALPCNNFFNEHIEGLKAIFHADMQGPPPFQHQWSFGDGNFGEGNHTEHTYSTPGDYLVTLNSINGDGCASSFQKLITIANIDSCNASFIAIPDPSNPLLVHFNNTSIGNLSSFHWAFGDGTTSILQNPDHLYSNSGIYNVRLKIISEDSSCMDESIKSIQVANSPTYIVAGQVLVNQFPIDHAKASLYTITGHQVELEPDTILPGEQGAFAFWPVNSGDYFIKGEPSSSSQYSGEYLPTYSGNTILWHKAQTFQVDTNLFQQSIELVKRPQNMGGNGTITGQVRSVNRFGDSITLNNIPVYLYTKSDDLVASAFTDNNGNYELSNLLYDNYYLFPDVTGLISQRASVTVSEQIQVLSNQNFTITPDGVVYAIMELPDYIESLSDIYPNPVSKDLKIRISLRQDAEFVLNIVDLTGRILAEKSIELPEGEQIIEVNIATLKAGCYLLHLSDKEGNIISRRFLKI
ncbi:MAG: PKD domain-containing protein [Sphingobacteriia bacterium]|nr:PKD domain-containing protein [Sphingobacteriia bacterium]